MTKSELAGKVSTSCGISQASARRAIDTILEAITAEVSKGGFVALQNFGTFKTHDRAARKGRNPKTGEPVNIPARTAPKFVPSGAFKDRVNV